MTTVFWEKIEHLHAGHAEHRVGPFSTIRARVQCEKRADASPDPCSPEALHTT